MRRGTLRPAVALLRAPNALTAAADVLAGFGAAGGSLGAASAGPVAALMAASALLYAFGVGLNDVVDADADREHRPDRPIPSGAISRQAAAAIALGAGTIGLALAALAGSAPLLTAIALAGAILAYDLGLKRLSLLGALALGACRTLNMGLGAALASGAALATPPPAFAFGAYVVALGAVGLGEEGGASREALLAGLAAMGVAAVATVALAPQPWALAILVLAMAPLALRVVPLAIRSPRAGPDIVRKAVREGVLAIPGIDAAILAGHERWREALVVVALFVFARLLARRLAVA